MASGLLQDFIVGYTMFEEHIQSLKDDLAFDVMCPGLGHSSSCTAWSKFFFLRLGNQCLKNDGEQKVLYGALIKRGDFL